MISTNHSQNTDTAAPKANIFSIILVIAVIVFIGYKYVMPKIDKSWVVDAAIREVKSNVYNDYGEIPNIRGNVIYKSGQHYIVIVKYSLPELDWKGSCACHVYGYRKGNVFVNGMTNELPGDYEYNTEELKAMWGIE